MLMVPQFLRPVSQQGFQQVAELPHQQDHQNVVGGNYPHPHLTAEEQWFHDPYNDPVYLSEPGYDLFLIDVCLAVAAKLQFSVIPQQREMARIFWYQAPPPVQDTQLQCKVGRRRPNKKKCKVDRRRPNKKKCHTRF